MRSSWALGGSKFSWTIQMAIRWNFLNLHHSQSTQQTCALNANRDADLATRRARQKLAERHQIGVRRLVQPPPPNDVLLPKVAQMCDGATERGQPQAGGHTEDLEDTDRALPARVPARISWLTPGSLLTAVLSLRVRPARDELARARSLSNSIQTFTSPRAAWSAAMVFSVSCSRRSTCEATTR